MYQATIGVTTHNESSSIAGLLTELATADVRRFQIIIYDDSSSDDTVEIIQKHPISRQPNFHLEASPVNHGGPALGRQFIADTSQAEFITLVDGDDMIRIAPLEQTLDKADLSADMIVAPYELRGRVQRLDSLRGFIEVTNQTVTRLISGIGSRIYRRELLANNICHRFVGRSEDARLNMNALQHGGIKIYYEPEACFYFITEARKSLSALQINTDELNFRVERFNTLKRTYDLDDSYLFAVKRNLFRAIASDRALTEISRRILAEKVNATIRFEAKRIVFLCSDLSQLGGVSTRVRHALEWKSKAGKSYFAVSLRNLNGAKIDNHLSVEQHEDLILDLVRSWRPFDTIVVTQNAIIRHFPTRIQNAMRKLPLVYFGDAQLAFLLQHTNVVTDNDFSQKFLVSRIVSLSDRDIDFQRQLGVSGQVKGILPVAQRETNGYKVRNKPTLGYVGICDFNAKATDRLVDLAVHLREEGLPKLKVFTTQSTNSPHYYQFLEMLDAAGVTEHCELVLGCSDKSVIFRDLSALVVPSKQESFGLAILEAFSFGIPVIASSEAPGPAELIRDGENGMLLDRFDGSAVCARIHGLRRKDWKAMSQAAFITHQSYTPDAYMSFIETIADETANNFRGENTVSVFPRMSSNADAEMVVKLRSYIKNREKLIADLRAIITRRDDLISLKDRNRDERNAQLEKAKSRILALEAALEDERQRIVVAAGHPENPIAAGADVGPARAQGPLAMLRGLFR